MPRVEASVVIARDVAEVFAFTDNATHEPVWRSSTVDAAYTSEGPPGVGTTGRETVRVLGRDISTEWEITEYVPNERVAYTVVAEGAPTSASTWYEYAQAPEGTRFTITIDIPHYAGFFGRLADTLVARIQRRTLATDLRRLKQLLEA